MSLYRDMTLVILTGAGISAESGVPTFRDRHGLWDQYDWQRLATPEAFAANPDEVHEFYNIRRQMMAAVHPNPAHMALAQLEDALTEAGEAFLLVTQNVDDLHRRAGSRKMIQMHGRLDEIRCLHCGTITLWRDECSSHTPCPHCSNTQGLRPNIVWFGEMPVGLSSIEDAMAKVSHFVAIGTSGTVYPAAALVAEASARGAKTTELNLEPSCNADQFEENTYGPASDIVPQWATAYLRGEL